MLSLLKSTKKLFGPTPKPSSSTPEITAIIPIEQHHTIILESIYSASQTVRPQSQSNRILLKPSGGKLWLVNRSLDLARQLLPLSKPSTSKNLLKSEMNCKKLNTCSLTTTAFWKLFKEQILLRPFPVSIICALRSQTVKN